MNEEGTSVKRKRKEKQPGKGPNNLQRTSGRVASSEEAKGEEMEEKEEENDKKKM